MEKAKMLLKRIFESEYYILALYVLCLITYFTGIYWYVIVFMALCTLLQELCGADFRYFIAEYALLLYSMDKKGDVPVPLVIATAVLLVPAAGLLVAEIIRNPGHFLSRMKKNKALLFMVILIFFMALSLTETPELGLSVQWTGCYILEFAVMLLATFKMERSPYLKKSLLLQTMGVAYIIFAEVLYLFIKTKMQGISMSEMYVQKLLSTGWGHQNHWAALGNMILLVSLYCFTVYEDGNTRLFSFLTAVVCVGLNAFSLCRGGWVGLAVTVPLWFAFYIIYKKHHNTIPWIKDLKYIATACCFLVAGILVLWKSGFLSSVIENLGERGFSDAGRSYVYQAAWNAFKRSFLTGSGYGSCHYFIAQTGYFDYDLYNYHNEFLQILGGCGILGLAAFLGYLYSIGSLIFRKERYHVMLGLLFLYLLVHGFLDTLFFNINVEPIFLMLLCAAVIEEKPAVQKENMLF